MNPQKIVELINELKSGKKVHKHPIMFAIGYLQATKAKHATTGQISSQETVQNAINYLKTNI